MSDEIALFRQKIEESCGNGLVDHDIVMIYKG